MKRLIGLLLTFSISAVAADPSAIISEFKTALGWYKISPISEQAFCYKEDSTTQGYQPDKLQRIASVTKVISTYFASETLDLNKTFETKIYISGNRLHIEGSRDPYFEEDKMMLLMQALNDLGYKSFSTVSFDKNFVFYDLALSAYKEITPELTRSRIATYLAGNNPTFLKNQWAIISNFAKEEGIDIDKSHVPALKASQVIRSDVNPLASLNPTVYVHKSKKLHEILKSMNVMSKNFVAQNVFLEASRIKKLSALLAEKGIDPKSFQIYNGSGLPIKSSKSRMDNLVSCRTVLKVVELLSESIKKHQLEMSDVMAVNGGKDLGSFRERFLRYPETHEAVISKTGTLMHASTLAGLLLIDGEVPFAILNHTTNVTNAKKFQDYMVSRLFFHLGEPTPMVYSKISIFPWDGTDFLELNY